MVETAVRTPFSAWVPVMAAPPVCGSFTAVTPMVTVCVALVAPAPSVRTTVTVRPVVSGASEVLL